jgi:hypothetical protein
MDTTFRSYEKYFDYKMYVFGHKYSSKSSTVAYFSTL